MRSCSFVVGLTITPDIDSRMVTCPAQGQALGLLKACPPPLSAVRWYKV
jgi:hypothetical protein